MNREDHANMVELDSPRASDQTTGSARWVGVDEAGYGPNLGPLTMAAVVAEGPVDRPPDFWNDLNATVDRAGGNPRAIWVDDSKRVYAAGRGLDRLEVATLATLRAAEIRTPTHFDELLESLGAGDLTEVELDRWRIGPPPPIPIGSAQIGPVDPFSGASWRITAVRAVVFGPRRFNRAMDAGGGSKAEAHGSAFARLLRFAWDLAADGRPTRLAGDKHGGRHYYMDLLARCVADCRIDRGVEGPALSHYALRDGSRHLEVILSPRADAGDGLVALASMIAKYLRERWMSEFNAYWRERVPDLRPTAGYPADAARFRAAIGPLCEADGLELDDWWRRK